MAVVFITSGTTLSGLTNWPGSGQFELIAGGAAGIEGNSTPGMGTGGGGGQYAKKNSLTCASNAACQVGQGGTTNGSAGTATWVVSTSTVFAQPGGAPTASSGAAGIGGGQTGNTGGVGDVLNNGGSGGAFAGGTSMGASGGGGAGGPNGAGANGGAQNNGGTSITGGTGGGGGGGGTNGTAQTASNTNGTAGGLGANGSGTVAGTGGTAGSGGASPTAGGAGSSSSSSSGGGGGGGGSNVAGSSGAGGGNGGAGQEWDATHGSGGGGGGDGPLQSGTTNPPGNGGLYGGGGAGGGNSAYAAFGTGANGIIVVTYTPAGGNTPYVGVLQPLARDWNSSQFQTRAAAVLPSGVGLAITPRSPVLGPAERRDLHWSAREYQTLPQYRVLPQGLTLAITPRSPVLGTPAERRDPHWSIRDYGLPAPRSLPAGITLAQPGPQILFDPAYRRDWPPWNPRDYSAPNPPALPAGVTIGLPKPPGALEAAYRRDPVQTWLIAVYAPIIPPAQVPAPALPQPGAPSWRSDQFQIVASPALPAGVTIGLPKPPGALEAAYRRDPWPMPAIATFIVQTPAPQLPYAPLPAIQRTDPQPIRLPSVGVLPAGAPLAIPPPNALPTIARPDPWPLQLPKAAITAAGAVQPPYSPPISYDRRDWTLLTYQVQPSTVPQIAALIPFAQLPQINRADWTPAAFQALGARLLPSSPALAFYFGEIIPLDAYDLRFLLQPDPLLRTIVEPSDTRFVLSDPELRLIVDPSDYRITVKGPRPS